MLGCRENDSRILLRKWEMFARCVMGVIRRKEGGMRVHIDNRRDLMYNGINSQETGGNQNEQT